MDVGLSQNRTESQMLWPAVTNTQQGGMGFKRSRGQTEWPADQHAGSTLSLGGETRGSTRVHFITFIAHPPSALSGDIQCLGPSGGAGRTGEHGEPASAPLSVNFKTIQMNKGSNPAGGSWECTLIQEAECEAKDQPLDVAVVSPTTAITLGNSVTLGNYSPSGKAVVTE